MGMTSECTAIQRFLVLSDSARYWRNVLIWMQIRNTGAFSLARVDAVSRGLLGRLRQTDLLTASKPAKMTARNGKVSTDPAFAPKPFPGTLCVTREPG